MQLPADEFSRLALEQADLLFRLARRLTGDPTKAEDLVQDTFVRALAARDNFDLQEFGIRPWLIRILRNLNLNRAERQKLEPIVIDDGRLDSVAPGDVMSQLPLTEGMDDRLVAALNELPADYQTVMVLWSVEDLSYKEIAEACEIPLGTVMSRLHRARSKMAEKLKDAATAEGWTRSAAEPGGGT